VSRISKFIRERLGGSGPLVVKGVPVAPGMAVGVALFHDEGDVDIPVLSITPEQVRAEHRRLATAIREAKRHLAQVEASIGEEVGRRDARIFSVQALLLDDPAFRKEIRKRIQDELVNTEVAVSDAVASWSERLAGVAAEGGRDPAADLRDVGQQLLRLLAGEPRGAVKALAEADGKRVILVTRELLPSDTAHLDRERLAAIVTASGGGASHAAILARGLGIPAVTDVDVGSLPARGGQWIVDGSRGEVILSPTEEHVARATAQSEEFRRMRAELLASSRGLARTADDVAIELMINVENFTGLPDELIEGLRGVGLFRTEFLFMERSSFPSEQQQYDYYVRALERLDGREVTFRTIDVGGDKPLSYLAIPVEPNPVLGWRGMRLSLQWPDMFYAQVRALLRASAHGPMRLLFPMITMVEELIRARSIVREIQDELREKGVPFDESMAVGVMIEVPAAALAARSMAEHADFFSIGTNDLSQYALAVDRNNARVADLYQPLHPGVLRLVREVIRAGDETGTPVSVCGEMAGDPMAALLLLGIGLRAFSISPYNLPVVRKLFAAVTLDEAEQVAAEVFAMGNTGDIRRCLRKRTLQFVPELVTLLLPEPDADS
jgi:phosphotransferase system enzyme I (PtsI)